MILYLYFYCICEGGVFRERVQLTEVGKHLYLWETRREHLCDFSSVSIFIFHLFCDSYIMMITMMMMILVCDVYESGGPPLASSIQFGCKYT